MDALSDWVWVEEGQVLRRQPGPKRRGPVEDSGL